MTSRTGRRGFTLIEVLVCVAVLSVGIIFIFESFFTCLNAFARYSSYLDVLPWMNEKLWLAEDEIFRQGEPFLAKDQGEFNYAGRTFYWQSDVTLIDKDIDLYRLNLAVSWQETNKKMELSRYVYAVQK